MNMTFKMIAKKLFGVRYERLVKTLLVYLIVFWGLHMASFQIQIAPAILYLMAGVMWQALSSEDNRENMLFRAPCSFWSDLP